MLRSLSTLVEGDHKFCGPDTQPKGLLVAQALRPVDKDPGQLGAFRCVKMNGQRDPRLCFRLPAELSPDVLGLTVPAIGLAVFGPYVLLALSILYVSDLLANISNLFPYHGLGF